jgi:hypothetical protein
VILLEIDTAHFAIFEFERDAPRPVDMDRIANRLKTSQWMKIETRDVHFFGSNDNVQTVEAPQDLRMHLRVDFASAPALPKLGKSLAFEASDHMIDVSFMLTYVNR